MDIVLPVWAAVALFVGFVASMILSTEGDDFELTENLGSEGRIVLGVLAGLVWPLLAVIAVARLVRAIWRGVMQCARLVMPAKPDVPRATARRRRIRLN